eukprot:TRINITY_DN80856_c0_g1_i1.p1 TRINITY_DN80856_c0_g1~~TRINITY_DN80856_c0_g1_i1.p1  ORF type:complete len:349 (+),score=8.09 TRINITY_DN80856_c0_g1_i1:65-1048(+)
MGYDSEPGRPPSYGPSTKWWVVNFWWVLLSGVVYSAGFVPIDTASRLVSESAPLRSHFPWALAVFARNVLLLILWYGTWHYALYVKRVLPHTNKYNREWSVGYCYERDRILAISGAVINSFFEVAQIYLWASGAVGYSRQALLAQPSWNLFWCSFGFYWSDVHFWFAHRVMHPWFRSTSSYDIGAALYRHVHSTHHKSYNPGPWSGLAMHPIEHLIYFTRGISIALLPVALHPVHFLTLNIRSMLGPAIGHHGFEGALGYKFHYLHHAKFEINYGTSCVVPIDNVLGTFSTDGVATRSKADVSWNSLMWLFGVPYLLPLACAAYTYA